MEQKLCPKCKRPSMSGNRCVFCNAEGEELKLAAGWKGYDRQQSVARSRDDEVIAAWKKEKAKSEDPNQGDSAGWIWSTLVAVVVVGGIGFMWKAGMLKRILPDDDDPPSASGDPSAAPALPGPLGKLGALSMPSVGNLPTQLKKPESSGRGDLKRLGRELLEFDSDTARHFVGKDQSAKDDLDHYRDRLRSLKSDSKLLEPQLNREETQVLFTFEHAEHTLDGFLTKQGTEAPDLEGLGTTQAKEQIERGLALARGEKVDDTMTSFKKKQAAEQDALKELTKTIDGHGN